MSIIVLAVGALIGGVGVAVLIAPVTLTRVLSSLAEKDRFFLVAILRIVMGVLLLLAADSTRLPMFVTVLGVLMILAGVLIPILGAARVKAWASWWMERGHLVLRLWALVAAGLGAMLVWVGS